MKKDLAILAILLSTACAAATIGVGAGSRGAGGEATAVVGEREADSESAEGIDLEIEQPEAPPVMGGHTTVDIEYIFHVRNGGASPLTVRRITIWSAGGAYSVENWSRTFKTKIAPGQTQKLPFWARATNVSALTGTNAPVRLRAELTVEDENGARKAVFVRSVNGTLAIGVAK